MYILLNQIDGSVASLVDAFGPTRPNFFMDMTDCMQRYEDEEKESVSPGELIEGYKAAIHAQMGELSLPELLLTVYVIGNRFGYMSGTDDTHAQYAKASQPSLGELMAMMGQNGKIATA